MEKCSSLGVGQRRAQLDRRIADLYANDRQCREAWPVKEISAAITGPGLRVWQIVQTLMAGYAVRPALGQRAVQFTTEPVSGRTVIRRLPFFETITYAELWERAAAVAGAWCADPTRLVRTGDFVAMVGPSSIDYTVIDLACVRLGAVAVPLHANEPIGRLKPIIEETCPRVIAASIDYLDSAVEIVATGHAPDRLIVLDFYPEVDDHRELFQHARQRLANIGKPTLLEPLSAVCERGKGTPPAVAPDTSPDSLSLLLYTSGSTGTPKGAMYPDRLVANLWSRPGDVPVIGLSLFPMSHGVGRGSVIQALSNGGTTYFATKSDLSTLFEDLSLVRPTSLPLVPRLWEMVYQKYRVEVDRRVVAGARLEDAEREVKADVRQNVLGGRFLNAATGSAPMSREMTAFVESRLGINLLNGYGATEAGEITLNNKVRRPPIIDYKLVDVPELGYFSTDKPYPRGELLIKSATLIPGYYKQPALNAQMFDEEGYFKTGDIMAELAPDELTHIDRRSNVLKLSQGEFVAVAHLEAAFANSAVVQQIYIYGSSERPYLVAVVVPTRDALANHGEIVVKRLISESLREIANHTGLRPYEIPRDFLIEPEPFTHENGLLSGTRKPLRPRLRERYGARLEQLYQELAEQQENRLRALRQHRHDGPVIDTVCRAAQALLGATTREITPELHITDLGGDSVSALTFSSLLHGVLDVDVPVGFILGSANNLRKIAEYIEVEHKSTARPPTAASVHGASSSQIRAGDLKLDKFLETEIITAAQRHSTARGGTVLLTGANGYLGRFLALEWLERIAANNGKLICLVRGTDTVAARQRLEKAFAGGDPELAAHFRELAASHLDVVTGDIGERNLGVEQALWRHWADTIELIMHPAALVNHVLPYAQLFGPNVFGTAEVIRLALTGRTKPVSYVSTLGVAEPTDPAVDPAISDERSDIRVVSRARFITDDYANGYVSSKWAAEVLLRQAHEQFGLPVRVFRCGMILAHRQYTGQLNVGDVFTRLLLTLIETGIAPQSFYRLDRHGHRQRAHYDGLPVDYVAKVLVTLGARGRSGYQTYHVSNPHDDGVGLDEFVDWLIAAGHPIARVDDYDEWFTRTATAMRALPETRKQHSLTPVLAAYQRPAGAVDGARVPTSVFQAALHAAGITPDRNIPHISPALIEKYATDLEQLGILTNTESRHDYAGAAERVQTNPS